MKSNISSVFPRSKRRCLAFADQKKCIRAIRLHSRLLLLGVKKGVAVRQVADEFSVTIRTVYRWLLEYKTGGKKVLFKFVAKIHVPVKTPCHVIEMILLLHETFGFGCQKIAQELTALAVYQISHQGVYRLLTSAFFSRQKRIIQ